MLFVVGLIVLLYGTIVDGLLHELLGVNHSLTLDHYRTILTGYGLEPVTDTVTLASIATPLAGILGVVVAFLVVRRRFSGRGALDFGLMLGVAVPGTIFGIGYLVAFNTPTEILGVPVFPKLTGGAAIFGGALAIVMVYILRSAPGGLRSGSASLQQIDPAIEEAAVSLGADQATTFRKVTLPLIRPAFLAGLIYSFARSMTAISAVIFLTTPSTRIMTAQILNETDAARYGEAFAYSTLLIVIVLVAIGLLTVRGRVADGRRAARRRRRGDLRMSSMRGTQGGVATPATLTPGAHHEALPIAGGRRRPGRGRRLAGARGRQLRDAAGSLGLRQDDDAAHDRGLRADPRRGAILLDGRDLGAT